jgi:hypothetical protein
MVTVDNDAVMLEDRADGSPHPARCSACGRKADPLAWNPYFRGHPPKYDVSRTRDGFFIVSERFREIAEILDPWGIAFQPLHRDPGYFWIQVHSVVDFPAEPESNRFEDFCPACQAFTRIDRAVPTRFGIGMEPLAEGFQRSRIEFGEGIQQSPLLLVGQKTGHALEAGRFTGLYLVEVRGLLPQTSTPSLLPVKSVG